MSSRQQRRQAERDRVKKQRTGPPTRLIAIGAASAIAIVVIFLIASTGGSDDANQAATALPGGAAASEFRTIPDGLTLVDFDDNPVELSSYLGRPLVINFWASWCVPCLAEMPGFEQVYQRRKAEVDFLGVNLQDEPRPAQAVIRQTGITYPVARDVDGSVFIALQGYGMPTTVFVSPDGEVLDFKTGQILATELEDRILSLFDL